jgi:hypothetical protein
MTQRNRFALRRRSSRKASRSKATVYRRFQTAGLEQLELRALLTAGPSSPDSALMGSVNAWESNSDAFSLRAMLASCSRSSSPTTDSSSATPAVSPLATMSYDTTDVPQDVPADNTADPAAATDSGSVVSPLVGTELARFKLEAEDMSDNVITTVNVGSDFQLVAMVSDLRDPAATFPGVWAAFMNIAYSSTLVSITAHPSDPAHPEQHPGDTGIEWGSYFANGLRFGNLTSPGQITQIGAASLASAQSGPGEVLLFKLTVHASAAGTVLFDPSFDSNPDHESSFIDPPDALTAAQINFVPLSLTIAGPPTVSITPTVSHNEGNTGTTPYVFDVSLSQASDLQTKVTYTTSNGTTQDGDFIAQSGTLTFAAGETTKSVTIGVVGDTSIESDESFNVTLSNPIDLVLGAASTGVGTIANDDFPLVGINSVSQNEGNTGTAPSTDFVFTVSLSEAINLQTKVTYTTSNGTTQDGDFIAQSGTLTFAAGQTTKSVTIGVVGDTSVEANETFNVTLSSPIGLVLGAASTGVGTITNDDVALIGVAPVSQLEGNADNNLVFEVTISTANLTQVLVPYTTSDGTAVSAGGSADYAATSGTLTFAAGSTQSQFVTVTIHGDTVNEDNESFHLVLTDPANADFDASNGDALATLLNDDGPHISFTQQNVSQAEGNSGPTPYVFTVDIGTATDIPVTVQYATGNGTATSPSDYAATSGTLTFLPEGQTTQSITVLVNGDTLSEANETFSLILSNPTNATITQSTATGTIENDDLPPSISFLQSAVSLTEGDAGNGSMVFTVKLSEASGQNVTVNFATTNVTTTNADLAAIAGSTLTFAPGETEKLITVLITGDLVDEIDETFTLNLTNPVGATLANPVNDKVTATGTILDNDIAPTMNIDSVTHDETNSGQINYTFTVTLSAASGQTVVVPFTTEDGTATVGGLDYIPTSGSITFLPGQTSRTITVQTSGDLLNETNETFKLTLTPPANVTAGTSVGIGTITNDDALPEVAISSSAPKSEGNSGTSEFFFEIQLLHASGQVVTVDYSTANGTADVTNDDYVGQSARVTFEPGATSKLITVLVNGDTRNEANETFTVFLTNPQNATLVSGQSSGQGQILNDDALPTISIGDFTHAEGNSGNTDFVFQVTLSALSGQQVTVVYTTADGTATVGNSDYVATSGTLTFAAGVGTQTVTVQVKGDLFDESDETFKVNLTNPTNATLADAQGIGTIQDEGTDNITFTLSTFAGKVFVDSDQGNDLDAVEMGLPGVGISVTGTSSVSGQAITRSFTTTATGAYSFADLEPGTYRVTFSQLAGYTKSKVITNGSNATALPASDASVGFNLTIPSQGGIQSTNNNVATIGLLGSNISMRFFLASKYAAASAAAASLVSDEVSPLAATNSGSDASQRSLLASSSAAESQIQQVGSIVTVQGTSGDDQFEFVAGDVNTITINGLTRHYNPADVTEFVFNGGGGHDTAHLTGSTGDEVADLGVGSGTLTGANFKVSVNNVSSLSVTGGGGADAATLHDSALSDHLAAVEDEVTLTNELGVVTQLVAFARVQALSASGGTDTVSIVEPLDIALEKQGNWLSV